LCQFGIEQASCHCMRCHEQYIKQSRGSRSDKYVEKHWIANEKKHWIANEKKHWIANEKKHWIANEKKTLDCK